MKNEAAALPRRIRVFGAPRTGKTQLAADLLSALSSLEPPLPPFAIEDSPALPLSGHECHVSDLNFLMGLDLPMQPADRLHNDTADRALRDALAHAGMAYQMVYGRGVERLQSALRAFNAWPADSREAAEKRPRRGTAAWVWSCDKCSDPQCERRLLSDLLAARVGTAGAP